MLPSAGSPHLKCFIFIALLSICTTMGCKKCEVAASCSLKADAGPCTDFREIYYFDSTTKTCKTFIYGGCGGLVPFETIVDCRKSCLCED